MVAVRAAFVPSDYFYENESPEVRSETWVVDGETYKVYYFDDKPTFLVHNYTLVADPDVIKKVVEAYYRELYPISQDNLEEIRALIEKVNASRFDNNNPYKIEEGRCRGILGENVANSLSPATLDRIVNSTAFKGNLYMYYTALLISNGLVPEGYTEEYVEEQIRYFFTNSDALSEAIANALNLTYQISVGDDVLNVTEALVANVSEIEERMHNIERARVLGINDREICGELGCLYLCPPPKYDYEALTSLKEMVNNLYETVKDYVKWKEVAESIINETEARLFYVFATSEKEKISEALQPLEITWNETKEDIQELLKVVKDPALTEYYNNVEELFDSIRSDLEKEEFNTTEEKVENLTSFIDKAKARYVEVKDLYEETLNYKELAGVLEKLIKDPRPVEDILRAKAELDRNFVPPISYATLKRFNERYKEVVEGLKAYYEQGGKKSDALFGLKKFIAGAANGIYALVQTLPAPIRSAIAPTLPVATTALMAVSAFFTTIFLGTLAYAKLYRKLHKRKLLYFTLLAIGAVIVSGVAALSYFPVSQLTELNDILPFAEYIAGQSNATLVVYLGTTYDDVIEKCAYDTIRELESLGVDAKLMEIKGGACKVDGREDSAVNCLLSLEPPYIEYKAGAPAVSGSLVGEVHLTVKGTKETFEKCELKHYLALLNQLKEG